MRTELFRMHRLARFRTAFVGVAAATALGGTDGCSSNGATVTGNSDDGGTADASIGCVDDPRGEKFSLNMTHQGDSGKLSFVISGATYNPPAVANNAWTMKILDSSGQPVNNANLAFPVLPNTPSDPWMPDHSHGAWPAKAKNNMDGTYTITPLYFFMGGIWKTYIQAQVGSVTDTTTFTFCVGS